MTFKKVSDQLLDSEVKLSVLTDLPFDWFLCVSCSLTSPEFCIGTRGDYFTWQTF